VKRRIEWTEKSWNPISGCKNTCYYCYARDRYQRHGWSFEPTFHPDRLSYPLKRKNPTLFFVCSVAELFGSWVPREWIDSVFDITKKCPQHIFQFLTKNPEKLLEFSPYPKNCWMGCSAIDQAMTETSLSYLDKVKAKIRFISFEPLLDSVDIEFGGRLEWIIIGACTGTYARQPKKNWVNSLLSSAERENIPVFIKPNLVWDNPPMNFPIEIKRKESQLNLF